MGSVNLMEHNTGGFRSGIAWRRPYERRRVEMPRLRTLSPAREVRFYLELPFDVPLRQGHTIQSTDPGAKVLEGWEAFSLSEYLKIDPPLEIGLRATTTFTFRRVTLGTPQPLALARLAFPEDFRASYRGLPMWRRARVLLDWPTEPWRRKLAAVVSPRRESWGVGRTIVEARRFDTAKTEFDDALRHRTFELLLDALNDYLEGIAWASHDADVRPVWWRELPLFVAGSYADLRRAAISGVVDRERFLMPLELPVPGVKPPVDDEVSEHALWISASADSPLVNIGSFLSSAWRFYERSRYGHAVIDCGTAAELLVDFAVRELGSVHGYDPRKLENVLSGGFKNRVVEHFAPLLGYDRDLGAEADELGIWWRDGYLLRNRVAHSGYRPLSQQAAEAFQATEALYFDVQNRMADDPVYARELAPPGDVIGSTDPAA
jgi:hypothetical protein